MAGWQLIQPIPMNNGAAGSTFPTTGTGYDTGSPGGSFTAWGTANAILVPNNGQIILYFLCGATPGGVTQVLAGKKAAGKVLPASTFQYTIGATSSGWLGPWSPQEYNIQDVASDFGTIAGSPGALPASAQGCVALAITTTTTLAIRAYQLIPVAP